ncbi:LysR family transcriptional regulator [soil metagenome]
MDQLRTLQVFVTVADLGSFTAAADRLGMSKAMVTRHVTALEERLGVRLLNRTTRRLSLTEAGQAYRDRARELLADIDAMDDAVGATRERPRGVLRVAAPISFGLRHLGDPIASFLASCPDVQIELGMSDRIVDIVDEGFDMAIRIATLAESSLVARQLSTTRRVACASPDYLARAGTPMRLVDLSGHRCLLYAVGAVAETLEAIGPSGPSTVRPNAVLRANNGDVLASAAVRGAGIVVLPSFIVADELASGRLVEVLADHRFAPLGIHVVYPHRRLLAPKVRAFVDHLVKVLPHEY